MQSRAVLLAFLFFSAACGAQPVAFRRASTGATGGSGGATADGGGSAGGSNSISSSVAAGGAGGSSSSSSGTPTCMALPPGTSLECNVLGPQQIAAPSQDGNACTLDEDPSNLFGYECDSPEAPPPIPGTRCYKLDSAGASDVFVCARDWCVRNTSEDWACDAAHPSAWESWDSGSAGCPTGCEASPTPGYPHVRCCP